jgi:hypothetical protein
MRIKLLCTACGATQWTRNYYTTAEADWDRTGLQPLDVPCEHPDTEIVEEDADFDREDTHGE